ncbi:MAG: hypothetical protein H7Z19_22315 [Chitinophagaceae bacterium]|nr:hypothetical protein [Rubrivivax sp.]
MNYPATRRDDITEEHFGTAVADPYRWPNQMLGARLAWRHGSRHRTGSLGRSQR